MGGCKVTMLHSWQVQFCCGCSVFRTPVIHFPPRQSPVATCSAVWWSLLCACCRVVFNPPFNDKELISHIVLQYDLEMWSICNCNDFINHFVANLFHLRNRSTGTYETFLCPIEYPHLGLIQRQRKEKVWLLTKHRKIKWWIVKLTSQGAHTWWTMTITQDAKALQQQIACPDSALTAALKGGEREGLCYGQLVFIPHGMRQATEATLCPRLVGHEMIN